MSISTYAKAALAPAGLGTEISFLIFCEFLFDPQYFTLLTETPSKEKMMRVSLAFYHQ